jgi:hypothetical protein
MVAGVKRHVGMLPLKIGDELIAVPKKLGEVYSGEQHRALQ